MKNDKKRVRARRVKNDCRRSGFSTSWYVPEGVESTMILYNFKARKIIYITSIVANCSGFSNDNKIINKNDKKRVRARRVKNVCRRSVFSFGGIFRKVAKQL